MDVITTLSGNKKEASATYFMKDMYILRWLEIFLYEFEINKYESSTVN
jgi:hypothetical protein